LHRKAWNLLLSTRLYPGWFLKLKFLSKNNFGIRTFLKIKPACLFWFGSKWFKNKDHFNEIIGTLTKFVFGIFWQKMTLCQIPKIEKKMQTSRSSFDNKYYKKMFYTKTNSVKYLRRISEKQFFSFYYFYKKFWNFREISFLGFYYVPTGFFKFIFFQLFSS